MSRVLLVKAAKYSRYNPNVTYPLGLMYLASTLEHRRHDEIKIIDLRCETPDIHKLLESFRPEIVGISALTVEALSMHTLADQIKKYSRKIKVICGGPHPTSSPDKVLNDSHIDCVAIGEGEETILELFTVLENSTRLEDVRGIGFRRNGHAFYTEERPPIRNIDALPYPAWHLVNIEMYSQIISQATVGRRRYMNLLTTRGCPYRCIYCHNIFGKEFRKRTSANVINEMRALRDTYGVNHFEIVDDIFNLDEKRAEDILSMVASEKTGTTLAFSNGLRGDRLSRGLLEKMKSAGTNYIAVALESASPRLQTLMKKNLNLDKLGHAISDASDLGMFTCLFTMIGFPTETGEEIRKTIDFACKSKAHTISVHIVTPFDGTALEKENKKSVKSADFETYDYIEGRFNLSSVSDKELFRLQWIAYARFYLNLRRLLRIFISHPDPRSIFYYLLLVMRKIILISKKAFHEAST